MARLAACEAGISRRPRLFRHLTSPNPLLQPKRTFLSGLADKDLRRDAEHKAAGGAMPSGPLMEHRPQGAAPVPTPRKMRNEEGLSHGHPYVPPVRQNRVDPVGGFR